MKVQLNNGQEHEITVKRNFGRHIAYIEVLGFHAYGRTEEEAIRSLKEILRPYLKTGAAADQR